MPKLIRLLWILGKFQEIPIIDAIYNFNNNFERSDRISSETLRVFLGNLHQYWWDVSYGNIDVQSDVCGWYEMEHQYKEIFKDRNPWDLNRNGIIIEARRVAANHGVTLSDYQGTCVIVNGRTDGAANGIGLDTPNIGMVTPMMGNWGGGQRGWKWCNQCNQLAFSGAPTANKCAGAKNPGPIVLPGREYGPHDFTHSENYVMPHGGHSDPDFPAGQQGWRWCKNCGALAFIMDRTSGDPKEQIYLYMCPSSNAPSGLHDYSQSGHYAVLHHRRDTPPDNQHEGGPGQPGWRFCSKCGGLFFAGNLGACAAGGDHIDAGGKYTLIDTLLTPVALNLSYSCHEIGHILGFNDACGGTNWDTYGDQTDIMSYDNCKSYGPSQGGTVGFLTKEGPGMNAPCLIRANWLPDARIRTIRIVPYTEGAAVPVPGVITLAALNHPNEKGYLAVQIKTPDRIYSAALRHNSGWDRGFTSPEVVIHEQRSPDYYADKGHAPFVNINLLAELQVNGKWEDTSRNISIHVDSINGITAELTVYPVY